MEKFIIANRFEINDLEKDLLGRGGMGVVYRATDTQSGETVAVKTLNSEALSNEPNILERFQREGDALRQLNHPNIVQFITAIESYGQHYLVMEYVDGGSLQSLLAKHGHLSSQRTVEISLDLADALTRAHHLGIIYRDLKPANVLLAQDGTPRLTDFGIAQLADSSRLTQTGILVGTVNYLSPEALSGEVLDFRTDIWAFGVLLFEMLTGRLPFTGDNITARISATLTKPVPDLTQYNLDIPKPLADLIYRMLEKDRQQRISSMRQVGAELESILMSSQGLPTFIESRFKTPITSNQNAKSNLPNGTVTFLFTDIEGSTKLSQQYPESMSGLLARHNEILNQAIESYNGYVFQVIGDSHAVSFHNANDALNTALQAQRNLHNENWNPAPIKVRMGIHTGAAQLQVANKENIYSGYATLALTQRIMSAGHGGQILLSQVTYELVRDRLPENAGLIDMGERRLKDILRAEKIYQLNVPDLPSDFAPLNTHGKIRNNLPTQLTTFIGREKEAEQIKIQLEKGHLVTLTGSGGVGKTRLSLQIATELLDQFPNGTWFVELAPITDPDLIPQIILTAADMKIQQGRSALDNLTDFLREKTSLLVLDNCEHLIEACAKLADMLLNAAPNLKILASSREALGVKGEQAWHVPSLSIPDLKHLPAIEQLSQYEAVRLFINRAVLAQPYFAVTDENANAVAQICSRLDGIPLAIELAAARVKVLKAEQIAERLNDRFRLLTGGSRTALPRQQTLRALIDWSYDLLAENEKLLLRSLAVFMGGCTLEAAEQVCTDGQIHAEDVLDLLIHLVDKSLVVVDEQPGQLRYRMLETVRQYAREKLLESGEGERIRTQHLAYFLKFAEEAEPHLVRKEQLEWFYRLELDHDNLRAALEWGGESEHNDPPEAGLRLVNALKFFWQMRGYWVEGKEWMSRVLAKDEKELHTNARARAYVSAAMFVMDNSKEIIKLCNKGLALGRELGDKPSIAESLLLKGIEVRNTEENLAGRVLLEESLVLFRELGDKRGMARAIYNIGYTAANEYDFPTARQCWEECLSLSREVGDRRFIAIALMSLGGLAMNQGDWFAARTFIEESLSLGRELGDKHGLIMYLSSLGMLELGQGDYQQSQTLIEESLAVARELGSKLWIMDVLAVMGIVARYQGDYEKAAGLQEESLAYSKEVDLKYGTAYSLYRLGELERLQGNFATAYSFLTDALKIAKESNTREAIAYSLEAFAALGAVQGQAKRSATLFGAAEALRAAIQVVLLPVERVEIDKNIAAARAQLSKDEFNKAWAEGKAMTMEEAVKFALEVTP